MLIVVETRSLIVLRSEVFLGIYIYIPYRPIAVVNALVVDVILADIKGVNQKGCR